jgi:Ser/Thr protein kinase RdoA (MazF antagonist)
MRKRAYFVAKTTTRTEVQAMWLLAVHQQAKAAGLITPELIPSDGGTLVANGMTLETFIPGHHPTALPCHSLADKLSHFHTLCQELPQRPGFASAADLLQQLQGGDIDLTRMPGALIHCCRRAWLHLQHEPTTVIHGDLNPSNIIVTPENGLALIDWDEARVDSVMFDTIALQPATSRSTLDAQAHLAFEIASSWQRESEYAQTLIPRLGCEPL